MLRVPPTETSAWCIVRVFADGRKELVTLAGEPWNGPEEKAHKRASVMQAEEPDVTFVVTSFVAPSSTPLL